MRVVVADATPLHYLILIDAVHVVPRLFERIHVPIEVRAELTSDATPLPVRTWMQHPPPWLGILSAPIFASEDPRLAGLHQGERAAILLADSMGADLLLIDDRAGAIAAQQRGLIVTGTLGVLDLASRARLLDLTNVFARLQKTNFRYPPSLIEALLQEEKIRAEEDSR
jgi:predicted nucleic acid-binding protein